MLDTAGKGTGALLHHMPMDEIACFVDAARAAGLMAGVAGALRTGGRMTLSLAETEHANSAGLVLLLEALDVARRNACELQLTDVPDDLMDLARMSQCEHLIS